MGGTCERLGLKRSWVKIGVWKSHLTALWDWQCQDGKFHCSLLAWPLISTDVICGLYHFWVKGYCYFVLYILSLVDFKSKMIVVRHFIEQFVFTFEEVISYSNILISIKLLNEGDSISSLAFIAYAGNLTNNQDW